MEKSTGNKDGEKGDMARNNKKTWKKKEELKRKCKLKYEERGKKITRQEPY